MEFKNLINGAKSLINAAWSLINGVQNLANEAENLDAAQPYIKDIADILAVYQMRLNDEKALPAEVFYQELQSLEDEKYKMVVSRQWKDEKGEAKIRMVLPPRQNSLI